MSHAHCKGRIKFARFEALEKGIKIPKFGGSVLVGYEQYGIFLGDYYLESDGCCSFEARAQAIEDVITAIEFKIDYDESISDFPS